MEHKDIIIDDRIMGSGKTYDAIRYINSNTERKFMYVTPFLTEVERIIDNTIKPFYQPSNQNEYGTKLSGLKELVRSGSNIVTTHALFHLLSKDDYAMFSDYELILDEVTTPVEVEKLSKKDSELLINNKTIIVNDDSIVEWVDKEYNGEFNEFRNKVETNNVMYVDDSFYIWSFPIEIFSSFNKTKILTYMFNGSIVRYYFDYNDIKYQVIKEDDRPKKQQIKKLLNIYQGNSNRIGMQNTALSVNWFKNISASQKKSVINGIRNVAFNNIKTKSAYFGYTTFKEFRKMIESNGYRNSFIPINSRATNDYDYKETMAYVANRYLNPFLTRVFAKNGVKTNQDEFALAEMIQWIWRGRIRKGKPMNLYIPSKRMRNLLINWLEN